MIETLTKQLEEHGPKAAFFVVILIGGLIAATIARRLTRWLVDRSGLDALAEKAGAARLLHAIGYRKGVSALAGSVVYAAGLLVTAAMAAESIGLTAVVDGVAAVLGFLPNLLAALVVLGAGAGLAGVLRGMAEGFGRGREDVDDPKVLGSLAYYGVMTLAVIVAAGQAGLETTLIETLLTTLASVTVAAIALAFALGSRGSFHNLVAGHFFKRLARPGDTVRIGDKEGVVVRYFGVSVVIRTKDGEELAVPCKVLLDETIGIQRLGAKARARLDGEGDTGADETAEA
ncbi:MAG: mechanosensitive ion channel [Nannocystaceae bacterium]|nr:mechanosensitive ion channel [Nannocystaceae bacterium]